MLTIFIEPLLCARPCASREGDKRACPTQLTFQGLWFSYSSCIGHCCVPLDWPPALPVVEKKMAVPSANYLFFFFFYLAVPGLRCSMQTCSCGMRDLVPRPGMEPVLPPWKHGVLATGPSESPPAGYQHTITPAKMGRQDGGGLAPADLTPWLYSLITLRPSASCLIPLGPLSSSFLWD